MSKNLNCMNPKILIIIISIQILLLVFYFVDFDQMTTYDKTTSMGTIVESETLSDRDVTSFCQDANQNMWIGTKNGLNIYNGKTMIQMYVDESDSMSLPDNQIQGIMLDSENRIWVSTPNGIARYIGGYRFKRIDIPYSNVGVLQMADWGNKGIVVSNGLKAYKIHNDSVSEFYTFDVKRGVLNYLYPDKVGGYWVVNPTKTVHYCRSGIVDVSYQVNRSNLAYCQQVGDTLWIGQARYITGISLTTNKVFFRNKKELPFIATIFFLSGDFLYLNSSYHGLYRLNIHTDEVEKVTESDMHLRYKDVTISTLYRDKRHNMWIGYQDGGFQLASRNYVGFARNNSNELNRRYRGQSINIIGATENNIIGSCEDEVFCYNLVTQKLKTYQHYELFSDSPFYRQTLKAVVPFDGDKFWLVTNVRIYSCIIEDGDIKKLNQVYSNNNIGPLLGNSIRIGNDLLTVSDSHYLLRSTFSESHVDSIFVGDDWFSTGSCLANLHDGRVAIIMKGMRLAFYDVKKNVVEKLNLKNQADFVGYTPSVAFVDSEKRIWIGTQRKGLLRFYPGINRLEAVKVIPNVSIKSIDEGNDGKLWISTNEEILLFSPERKSAFFSFIPSPERLWIRYACQVPNTGLMAYGTNNGVVLIPVDKIKYDDRFDLNVTGIRLHNENNEYKYLAGDFKDVAHYTFLHTDNDITVEFSCTQFGKWQHVMYQCKLEGYDKNWRVPQATPNIHFTNLPSGNYVLRVKLITSPGQPALAERSLRFSVKPPFVCSFAAIYLYFLIAGFIIYYINHLYLNIHKNRMMVEQLELDRKRDRRVNDMNMSFFANISHEFRNPLTLIAGPLLVLRRDKSLPVSVRHTVNMVCKSVNQMLKLIDQMLDFNQLENDVLRLKVAEYDVMSELEALVMAFEESTKLRNISVERGGFRGNCYVWMDKDKFEKIMSNLFTNALKHTPDNGIIRVSFRNLSREQAVSLKFPVAENQLDFFMVQVYNSGENINPSRLSDVFKRYYQINTGSDRNQYGWGSGIGLYYVSQLVRLHRGMIWVKNEPFEGVSFQFILPSNEQAYLDSKLVLEDNAIMQIPVDKDDTDVDRKIVRNQDEVNAIAKRPVILIVDDDMAVAQYMRSIFASDYIVYNKYSAESALADIESISPDIILSDVVMDDIDGYRFCKAVRSNKMLCHVPVILITAKSNVPEQIEGLESGANAYVTKPFDPHYLKALVESQLKNLRQLKEKMEVDGLSVGNGLSEPDRKFMSDLYAYMEKHLSEQDLNITTICADLLISHSKFNYKLKELTGETPGHFFRKYKLNKAAKLLREGKYNISEVADQTGFGTVSYFSVSFKKYFGVSPSEYK